MNIWSTNERVIVRDALREGSALREALAKFLTAHANDNRRSAQSAMQSVPRQWELAADYMAKAAEDDEMISLLVRAVEQD